MREIVAPFVVARPAGARVRTRLRVSETDAAVLWQVGRHLAALAGEDLARRCAVRTGSPRGPRKKALTGQSSSRWAGAVRGQPAPDQVSPGNEQFELLTDCLDGING